jgi:hypothetical protein
MYQLVKMHKTPLKTRAIISYSGSLCEGIAKWLDVQLKKIIKHLPYIATSSATVVQELLQQHPLPTSSLFTMDAVSMYTSIHLGHALPTIKEFLQTTDVGKKIIKDEKLSVSQLEYAIELIMKNNIFKFGDTYWQQIAGTAMGTPPAPNYATFYFAIFEYATIKKFPELTYYRRYIDDGFGIWTPMEQHTEAEDLRRWNLFKETIGNFGKNHPFFIESEQLSPLCWKFITSDTDTTERSKNKIFLDLNITLTNDSKIHTKIYEKDLNLYLYLPPHSCHAPGTLKGLIFGFAHRAYALCTNEDDRIPFLRKSYYRLLARGHQATNICPMFQEAIEIIFTAPPVPTLQTEKDTKQPLYFHLPFNPVNPPSTKLQSIFESSIVLPPNRQHISEVETDNAFARNPDIDRCVICYSGQHIIGNLLAPRKHRFGTEFSVDNFLRKLQDS